MMITETLDELIKLFCKQNGIYEPYDAKDTEKVLERMKAIGLVDQKEIEDFSNSVKDNSRNCVYKTLVDKENQ